MKKEIMETKPNESWCGLEQGIPAFLKGVFDYAASVDINIDGFEIDHIGLRIKELSEVEILRNSLNQVSVNSEPISNSVVNGRSILIYKLKQPIEIYKFKIGCIECLIQEPIIIILVTDGNTLR